MGDVLTEIGSYLWVQSWQIAVVFVVVAGVCRALRSASAHWRYLLWLVVLAKCLVPPLVTFPIAVLPVTGVERPSGVEPELVPVRRAPTSAQQSDSSGTSSVESTPLATAEGAATGLRMGAAVEAPESKATVEGRATSSLTGEQWTALTWLVGALVMGLVFLVRGIGFHHHLQRTSRSADAALQDEVKDLAARVDLKNAPRVLLTDSSSPPFVWGLVRGTIYLPSHFGDTNTTEQRRAVLMHELAHVARWDAALNTLQTFLQCVLFFHPLVWLTNARIRSEREKCCDEIAIASLDAQPGPYGTAIIEFLAARNRWNRSISSLAVTGSNRDIEERIGTIMRENRKFYRHPTLPAWVTAVFLLVLAGPTAVVLTARAEAPAELDEERSSALAPEGAEGESLVMVPCVRKYSVMLVVSPRATTFEGRELTWAELPEALKEVPHRDKTILAYAVTDRADSKEAKRKELVKRLHRISRGLGFEYLSFVGVHPLGAKGGTRFEPIVKPEAFDSKAAKAMPPRAESETILVPCVRKYSVMLVISPRAFTFEGKELTWAELPAALKTVPHRDKTILAYAVTDRADDTEARQRELAKRLYRSSRGLGFEYLSFVGVHPLGAKGGSRFEPVLKPEAFDAGKKAATAVPSHTNSELMMVPCVRKYSVMLVVGESRMTFEGQDVSWKKLPALLEDVPHPGKTTLRVALTDPSAVTETARREILSRAARSYQGLGFEGLSYVGQHPLGSKGSAWFEPIVGPEAFELGEGDE